MSKKVLIWVGVVILALVIAVVAWNILPTQFRIVSTISWVIGAVVGAFGMYKGYKWWLTNVKSDGTVS